MSVYIEPLIVQNLLFVYVVSATSYRFLRMRLVWWRLLSASMFGCIVSVFYPFIYVPLAVSVLLKLLFAAGVAVILFVGKCPLRKGIVAYGMALCLFGGDIFCIGCLLYRNMSDALTKPLPMYASLSIAVGVALYTLLRNSVLSYHRHSDCAKRVFRYRMTLQGKEIDGYGFMDTGNRLYDRRSGLPVVILEIRALLPHLDDDAVGLLLTGHTEKVFREAYRMPCKGIGGASALWVIAPEKFEVYFTADKNIVYDVMVGLSFSALSGGENYDAILHPALSEVFENEAA